MVDVAALCRCGYVTILLMDSVLWKEWHGEDRVVGEEYGGGFILNSKFGPERKFRNSRLSSSRRLNERFFSSPQPLFDSSINRFS
jgi:hypothetical protein